MNRIDKINAEITRQLAEMINYEMNDPRLSGGMVSVLRSDTTTDLKHCKVYVSVMGIDGNEALKALTNAAGHFKSNLAKKLTIRTVPDIKFILDDSIEYSIHLTELLNKMKK